MYPPQDHSPDLRFCEALAALQDQCSRIEQERCADGDNCTTRIAAVLTWLTKGLEHRYGLLPVEAAKARFAIEHKLNTIELLLIKPYVVRFHSWEPGDWWLIGQYLDCLSRGMPPLPSFDDTLALALDHDGARASRAAIQRFAGFFWDARRQELKLLADASLDLISDYFDNGDDD